MSDALIRSRDGIVGQWRPPAAIPDQLGLEDRDNLERWSPWVRASVIDAEMVSRLGFTLEDPTINPRHMAVWHLEVPAPAGGNAPVPVYKPLILMARPTEAIFEAQLTLVNNYAELRPDRQTEILAQIGGGMAFLSSIAQLHPDRTPRTLELLAAVLRLALFVHLRVKQGLACRRPLEYSPQIQPMIATPAHGALPSGHATESFAAALVLWQLMKASGRPGYDSADWRIQLLRLASRIAINRTVAGVHFPVDSAAGAILGLTLGQYLVNRCSGAAGYRAWRFEGEKYPEERDFIWHDLYDVTNETLTSMPAATGYSVEYGANDQAIDPQHQSYVLTWLWDKAKAEWE
jgi:membrane-associated phospholipid phosphatase